MCGIPFQIEISLQFIFPFKPQLQAPYFQIAHKNNK